MKITPYIHKPAEVKQNTFFIIGDRNLINSILRDAVEKGLIKSYEMSEKDSEDVNCECP